ncbi:Putative glycoside hydrolase family 3 domain, immunoglobulin-like, fibronectin type III-like protein [Septoria linicola]|uniref:beta-glucosidase n=1 Tax=Septoria linicola TaxID=215465 RepID=A0A9Q9B6M4_9PEZI|nr:Putative glycoside hydrolase family 3 domain, immunoglobulin-like, fibronectin type III-like protein [Septoria linicola]
MFLGGGLNVSYYTTTDWYGPVNSSFSVLSITAATYPANLWQSWPQVFSCIYEGTFMAETTGMYHFSLTGQGDAMLFLGGKVVANMSKANFGNTVQGVAWLSAGEHISLKLKYSMGYSLSTGAYGVSLGVDPGDLERDRHANELAEEADLSVIFASDRLSESADSSLGLSLLGDQDDLILRLAARSNNTLVVLNTNSAVLMPWIDEVDASLEDTIKITSDLVVPYDEGLYVGYQWYDKHGIEPLFAFGHGLTYSTFDPKALHCGLQQVDARVICATILENTGPCAVAEVVQLYVAYPQAAQEPPKLLRAFEKIYLEPGEASEIVFEVSLENLRIWLEDKDDWSLVQGNYTFMAGFPALDIQRENRVTVCLEP